MPLAAARRSPPASAPAPACASVKSTSKRTARRVMRPPAATARSPCACRRSRCRPTTRSSARSSSPSRARGRARAPSRGGRAGRAHRASCGRARTSGRSAQTENSRSPASGFGSITSHGSRCAASTFSPCRSWFTSTCSPCVGASSPMRPSAASRNRGRAPRCMYSAQISVSSSSGRKPSPLRQSRGSSSTSTPIGSGADGEKRAGLAALEQQRVPLVVAGEEPHRAVAVPALERVRLLLRLAVRPEDLQHRGRPVAALDPHDMAAQRRVCTARPRAAPSARNSLLQARRRSRATPRSVRARRPPALQDSLGAATLAAPGCGAAW